MFVAHCLHLCDERATVHLHLNLLAHAVLLIRRVALPVIVGVFRDKDGRVVA